jgi:predicted GTPase
MDNFLWIFIILFISFLSNNYTYNSNANKIILILGPTRSGKSCFINTITGYNLAKVGDDSGDSTTKDHEIYESFIDGFPRPEKFKLVDSMGLDDSDESGLADPMILASTLYSLREEMEKTNNILKSIYVFESLTNDSNQIQKTIKKIKAVFGEEISKNIVVLLNKNPKPNKRRLDALINKIKNENITSYIHWLSGCGKDKLSDEYYQQINNLHNFTAETDSITAKQMKVFLDELEEEGKRIFAYDEENIFKKYKKYFEYGGVGILLAGFLNIPVLLLANLAYFGFQNLYSHLYMDEKFLISVAIENRIKTAFNKD